MNTCNECGTVLKGGAALMSHRGSRPCRLAKTQQRMDREGWKPCTFSDAREVLNEAEIEHEEAPALYIGGGMVSNPTARFRSPDLINGTYCPAWAVPIVDCTASFHVRVRVLRWAARQTDDDARSTVLALVFPDLGTFAAALEREESDGQEADL